MVNNHKGVYHPEHKMSGNTSDSHRFIDRRSFIGGSDARIIMGDDDATLVRLWREKRGEAEPQDLSPSTRSMRARNHRM